MEPNEINSALDSIEDLSQFFHMTGRIVQPFKHDVFKRYSSLMAKVPAFDFADHFCQRISNLDGHQFFAFVIEWSVHTDCQVCFRLLKESKHAGNNSNG